MIQRKSFFTIELWNSFLAMIRYFPRVFIAKRVRGRDFYSTNTYHNFKRRVTSLRPSEPALWGKMDVAQMLLHINLSMGSGQGYYFLPDESNFLSKTIIKWMIIGLYSEQPKGLQLPISMAIKSNTYCDFEFEKERFLEILEKATMSTNFGKWTPHSYFGKLSASEWGKLCLVHIDYHLKQFGC
ncbi:hypothetical protein ABIB40_003077 [Pedobacter sp. UYP30]|uniref:DUF1569 domain-containing protein n=1 Tax=Pedobacter sp. UYP30 TaxID=1756400 RepID=UPI003391AD9B